MVKLKNQNDSGFSVLWMMVIIFLLTFIIGHWAQNYMKIQQREKEVELLRIGLIYREAIQKYYTNSPIGISSYPEHLSDLVLDPRVTDRVVRYIRKVEKDPLTGQDFILIKNKNNQIIGLHSPSNIKPLQQEFASEFSFLNRKEAYTDWKFIIQN